jgi:hypothetical protein
MFYLTELGQGLPVDKVISFTISGDYPYFTDEQLEKIKVNPYDLTAKPECGGYAVTVLINAVDPKKNKLLEFPVSKTFKTREEADKKLIEIMVDINKQTRGN